MTDRAALARPLAAVTTATVDIQVLRIGTKQMTLAVFKQLLRDNEVTGQMWGTVNYHHRDFHWYCTENHETNERYSHRHVVWQKEDVLRHAILFPPELPDRLSPLRYIADRLGLMSGDDADTARAMLDHFTWDQLQDWKRKTLYMASYERPQYLEELAKDLEDAKEIAPYVGREEREEEERRYDLLAFRWEESGKLPQLFIAV